MLEKIKLALLHLPKQAKHHVNKLKAPVKLFVAAYFMLVMALVITYYGVWVYQCVRGIVVMNDLLAVIREMIGTAMIGFMTFIAGCFVDMNDNGIPDKFEEAKDNEKSNP